MKPFFHFQLSRSPVRTAGLGNANSAALADQSPEARPAAAVQTVLKQKPIPLFAAWLLIAAAFLLLLAGCGKPLDKEPLTKEQFRAMYSNVKAYKGRTVELYGEIFATPQRLDEMVYLQVYADPVNQEQSVIVAFKEPGLDVQNGDYVYVRGKVNDHFTGVNRFGNKLRVPRIVAQEVERIDPATALTPSRRRVGP